MATTPVQTFGPITVNAATPAGDATNIKSVQLANGNILVAYLKPDLSGDPDFYTAVFDPLGGVVEAEKQTTFYSDDVVSFDLIATADGAFYVAHTEEDDGSDADVEYGFFRLNGSLETFGGIDRDTDANIAPAATLLDNGNIAVAYQDKAESGDSEILYQIRSDTGALVTSGVLSDGEPDGQSQVQLATLSNGNWVAVYTDETNGGAATDSASVFKIFEDDGTEVTNTEVDISSPFSDNKKPDVAALANGGFVAVWQNDTNDQIQFEVRSNTGTLISANDSVAIVGFAFDPKVTALPDGNFVIVWDETVGIAADLIRGQVFDATGTPIGSVFSYDLEFFDSRPSITTLNDGRIVITSDSLEFLADPGNVHLTIYDPRDDTVVGTDFGETLTAAASGGLVQGLGGNDQLIGSAGIDRLEGGSGIDSLLGGDSNDVLLGGRGADFVAGGAGFDTIFFATSTNDQDINLAVGTAEDEFGDIDVVAQVENVRTGNGADTITGSMIANQIVSAGGNDFLSGLDGNDTLLAGNGNDRLFGGNGADVLNGGGGILDQADYRFSSAGVTVNLIAGTGSGGEAQGDTLIDIETVIGSNFGDLVIGNAGANRLLGLNGNDNLNGAAGADIVNGQNGADTINGGAGDDQLFGGAQADTFVFSANAGDDTIKDFANGVDRINVDAFNTNFASINAASFNVGADLVINLSGTDSITIENFSKALLDSSDFIF